MQQRMEREWAELGLDKRIDFRPTWAEYIITLEATDELLDMAALLQTPRAEVEELRSTRRRVAKVLERAGLLDPYLHGRLVCDPETLEMVDPETCDDPVVHKRLLMQRWEQHAALRKGAAHA